MLMTARFVLWILPAYEYKSLPTQPPVIRRHVSFLCDSIVQNLRNEQFQLIRDEISRVIQPDARSVMGYTSLNMQRCFAVKVGINDLLDIARQAYCELIDDMKTMVENLSVKYKLFLALGCNSTFGYYIQMDVPRASKFKVADLPEEFIEVQMKKNTILMTTNALLVLNQQCKIACEELHVMSNVLLSELLGKIREHIGCLFQLSADVAELDLVISLAQTSSLPEYVRPSFGTRLKLKDSMHPIMDVFGSERPVPNDVHASVFYNYHNILGTNMSGKSVYLKQIVLLSIMAQIGCYVPAAKAEFRIVDRIFCRMSHRDDIECNASTFVVEVKEAQYILQAITPKSLVILDELCRATTVEEGSSIAWAICERLLATKAFVFCATHFSHLIKLADLYHNATNHCFETITRVTSDSAEPRLTYTHKLRKGIGLIDNYGIGLAELSSLPKSLTIKAREYASAEHKSFEANGANSTQLMSCKKLCYDRVAKMYNLLESNRFTRENIMNLVANLDTITPHLTTTTETEKLKSSAPTTDNQESKANENVASVIAPPVKSPEVTKRSPHSSGLDFPRKLRRHKSYPNISSDTNYEVRFTAHALVPKNDFHNVEGNRLIDDVSRYNRSHRDENEKARALQSQKLIRPVPSHDQNILSRRAVDIPLVSDIESATRIIKDAVETSSQQTLASSDIIVSDNESTLMISGSICVCDSVNYEESQKSIADTPDNTAFSGNYQLNPGKVSFTTATVTSPMTSPICSNYSFFSRQSADRGLSSQSSVSGMSITTNFARITARRKEAEIFKKIEVNTPDETNCFESTQFPMFIDLFNDKSN